MSYSKFKYEQNRKARDMKKKTKQKKDKGMRFPATIDIGDKNHKLKRVREFLDKGHKVKIAVYVKGRLPFEKAVVLMDEIRELLTNEEYKTLEDRPSRQGRGLNITFLPN